MHHRLLAACPPLLYLGQLACHQRCYPLNSCSNVDSKHVISVSQWRLIAALMRPAAACSHATLPIDASMVQCPASAPQ